MDAAHSGVDMSPLYIPRKRRSVQSQPRTAVPVPVVQRLPERSCGYPKTDSDSQAQDALKMKRSSGRKRYEDMQSVSMGTADNYASTSCAVMSSGAGAVMSSGGLANGTTDCGSVSNQNQNQSQPWSSGRDRHTADSWTPGGPTQPANQTPWNSDGAPGATGHYRQDQGWIPPRDRDPPGQDPPDQGWMTDRQRGGDQVWGSERDPGRAQVSKGPEQTAWGTARNQEVNWSTTRANVWRPDLNMKKVLKVELQRTPSVNTFTLPPEGRDECSDTASVSDDASEQKPPVVSTKKEPPTYPPGSPEEQWQVQIVAKGRVTCPKCKSVSRKTVEGLKKHMDNCRLQPFNCPHCEKQLKSSTGMKYHILADHSHLPSAEEAKNLDDRVVKEQLRKILKRLGKLKCSQEGCTSAFTSIMGYVYHMKKCGKEESELEKLLLNCSHCGKAYRSKAGLEYHLKSEHAPTPKKPDPSSSLPAQPSPSPPPERTPSGRPQRTSAQIANLQLAEIAHSELPKDWDRRRFVSDLVPDDKKLKYTRPGLPAFSQEVLRKWKNEVKLHKKIHCPNEGCDCTYTSVSGLKAHLGLCTRGDFEAGKYTCLICSKEFHSESGVKYHIKSVHSQEWFVTNKKACKTFEKFLKSQPKETAPQEEKEAEANQSPHPHHHHHNHNNNHIQTVQQYQPYYQHPHNSYQHPHTAPQHPIQPPSHHPLHTHTQFHSHPEQQDVPTQVHSEAQDTQPLHYTSLEPPLEPLWVEMDHRRALAGVDGALPGPEQAVTRPGQQVIMGLKQALTGQQHVSMGPDPVPSAPIISCAPSARIINPVPSAPIINPGLSTTGPGQALTVPAQTHNVEMGMSANVERPMGGIGVIVLEKRRGHSSSRSKHNNSSSSSESHAGHRHSSDQWHLKRPVVMETHATAGKRHRNT